MIVIESWQSILLWFLAVCGGFTTVCVAAGWLIKIIKGLKKPSDDVKTRLSDNEKDIKELRRALSFMLKAVPLLLQDDLVILEHLRTSNNTGKMQEQEDKVHEFLLDR